MRFRKTASPLSLAGAVILAAAAPMLAPAATDFSKMIPDDAIVAGWTGDVPAVSQSLEQSPYGQLWKDQAAEPLRTFVTKQIDEANEKAAEEGLPTIREAWDVLKGGVAFYFTLPGETFEPSSFVQTSIIEIDEEGRAWFEEKVQRIPEMFDSPSKASFETSGVTVYQVSGDMPADPHQPNTPPGKLTIHYAYPDGYFVITEGETDEAIKGAINALKAQGAPTPLRNKGEVQTYAEKVDLSPDKVHLYVDSDRFIKAAVEGTNVQPKIAAALPTTGLYDLDATMATLTSSQDGASMNFGIVSPSQKSGLVKVLKNSGPVDLSVLEMAPADAIGVSAFSLDLGGFFEEALTILNNIAPQIAGGVQMGLASTQMQFQVDLRKNIIGNISGDHLVVNRELDEEIASQMGEQQRLLQQSQAFFLEWKNGDVASDTLKTLFENLQQNPNMGINVTLEEQKGITIAKFNPPAGMPSAMSWGAAFNENYLVFANNNVQLQQAVRSLSGDVPENITSKPAVQKILNQISAEDRQDLQAFTYSPPRAMEQGIDGFRRLIEMGMFSEFEGLTAEMVPPADAVSKYFGESFSTVTFGDRLFLMTSYLEAPER